MSTDTEHHYTNITAAEPEQAPERPAVERENDDDQPETTPEPLTTE